MVRKFGRRIRQGDVSNALYLSYYYAYLAARDARLGTHFAGSTMASELGGSDALSTGNFPAHPRIAKRLLSAVPNPDSKSLVDVGCGSGSLLHVALDVGFERVLGIELFPEAAAIAEGNINDPRCTIKVGDALTADLRSFDVMTLFNPFPMIDEYLPLIERAAPTWVVLVNLEAVQPPGYAVVDSYRHRLYKPFVGRLLEKSP